MGVIGSLAKKKPKPGAQQGGVWAVKTCTLSFKCRDIHLPGAMLSPQCCNGSAVLFPWCELWRKHTLFPQFCGRSTGCSCSLVPKALLVQKHPVKEREDRRK